MRKSLIIISASALLFGCGRPNHLASYDVRLAPPPSPPALMAPPAPDIVVNSNANFSYVHALTLLMPHASVESRYERARARCLSDAALNCKLISSSLDKEDSISGQLVVAVPHDKVGLYEKALSAPVAGEKPGDAVITSSSTSAENVTQAAATASRKATQLSNYRDRLLALLKRPNLSVDDLIKVEGELAKTQSDLDDALSEKNDVDDRVAREQIMISLNERAVPVSAFQPIADVWKRSVAILADSTANALEFTIAYIPWIPLFAIAIFFVLWLWRIARRRSSVARSRPE